MDASGAILMHLNPRNESGSCGSYGTCTTKLVINSADATGVWGAEEGSSYAPAITADGGVALRVAVDNGQVWNSDEFPEEGI